MEKNCLIIFFILIYFISYSQGFFGTSGTPTVEEGYPVGSVYENATDNTNPATLLGFGTWTSLGAGRRLAGYDSGDTAFDASEETGGAKTVTLTETELPPHTHSVPSGGGLGGAPIGSGTPVVPSGQTTGGTGSGTAYSIMNPYIVVYRWKRTT